MSNYRRKAAVVATIMALWSLAGAFVQAALGDWTEALDRVYHAALWATIAALYRGLGARGLGDGA